MLNYKLLFRDGKCRRHGECHWPPRYHQRLRDWCFEIYTIFGHCRPGLWQFFFYFGMYCVVKFVCLSVIKTLFFLQDLNLSTERLTSNKAFTNKLWNAGKFLLQNLPDRSDVSAWDALLANKVPNWTSSCTWCIH